MHTQIRIVTDHPRVPFMMQQDAPEGVRVVVPPVIERRGFGMETLHDVWISFEGVRTSVIYPLLVNWIWRHYENRKPRKIEVDGKEIGAGKPLTQEDLIAALELAISESQKRDGSSDDGDRQDPGGGQ